MGRTEQQSRPYTFDRIRVEDHGSRLFRRPTMELNSKRCRAIKSGNHFKVSDICHRFS